MRGADSSAPAAGNQGRSRRPGFTYEIRLVGGEAGRRLEAQQAAAIAEVLAWLAAHPHPAPEELARAARAVPEPAGPSCSAPQVVGWPYGLQTRARAVGLVGVGRPVGEVAGLVGCIHRRCAAGSARPQDDGQTRPTPRPAPPSAVSGPPTWIRVAGSTSLRCARRPVPLACPCRAPLVPLACPCWGPRRTCLTLLTAGRSLPASTRRPAPRSLLPRLGCRQGRQRIPGRAIWSTSQLRPTRSSARIRLIGHPCSTYLLCR